MGRPGSTRGLESSLMAGVKSGIRIAALVLLVALITGVGASVVLLDLAEDEPRGSELAAGPSGDEPPVTGRMRPPSGEAGGGRRAAGTTDDRPGVRGRCRFRLGKFKVGQIQRVVMTKLCWNRRESPRHRYGYLYLGHPGGGWVRP